MFEASRYRTALIEGLPHPLLYAYRVSLTGIHLLRTGHVNANLAELAPEYGYGYLLKLIAAKTSEHASLELPVDEHDAALARLQDVMSEAYEASSLPPEPINRAALDDFVVRVRLAQDGYELDRT